MKDVLLIILSIFIILVGLVIAWKLLIVPLLIKKVFLPNAKPLTDEELRICEGIVREGKGYPYVCRLALEYKRCGCLPCHKLEQAKMSSHAHDQET